jgi:uncharacterized Zn finger protein
MAYYDFGDFYDWRSYVTASARRRQAAQQLARLKQKGQDVSPVVIDGRTIAKTFWGKAWCANLERYSDYANRLPRGRSYVRGGSVVDLRIAPGAVRALVSGSSLYRVQVTIAPLPKPRWRAVCRDCAGAIDSLVELLQGRFPEPVAARICDPKKGLFPSPSEIVFTCSCPDWASMCKHVAAVLYGIGARLDTQADLLFVLRKVKEQDLIARAGRDLPDAARALPSSKVLDAGDLSELFGIEIAPPSRPARKRKPAAARRTPARRPRTP